MYREGYYIPSIIQHTLYSIAYTVNIRCMILHSLFNIVFRCITLLTLFKICCNLSIRVAVPVWCTRMTQIWNTWSLTARTTCLSTTKPNLTPSTDVPVGVFFFDWLFCVYDLHISILFQPHNTRVVNLVNF